MIKNRSILLIVITGFFHVIFFSYQLIHERFFLVDSYEYMHAADNILSSGTLYSGDFQDDLRLDFYSKRPPIYPFFLAFGKIVEGFPFLILLLQGVLGCLNVWLALSLVKILAPEKEIPWKWLIPFFLIYPAQFIYANLIMTELLFQTWLIGFAILLIKAFKQNSWVHLLLAAGVLLLAMFTKPVMYLFIIPFVLFALVLGWKWKQPAVLLAALLPMIVMASYVNRNYQRTGFVHFSSIQNLSLLQYTTYNLLTYTEGPDRGLVMADSILYESLDAPTYAEGQKLIQNGCSALILDRKTAYFVFHLKGMFNFFLDPGRFDLYKFFGVQKSDEQGFTAAFSKGGYKGIGEYLLNQPLGWIGLLLLIALGNLVKLISLIFLSFERSIPLIYRGVLLVIILYLAGVTGASGASRFAVPLFPFMIVSLCFFLNRIRSNIQSRAMFKIRST